MLNGLFPNKTRRGKEIEKVYTSNTNIEIKEIGAFFR